MLSRPSIKFIWFSVLIIVLILSILPGGDMPSVKIWDKLQHSLAYFALMLLFLWDRDPQKPVLIYALLHIGVGVGIEFVQNFVPDREMELTDIWANSLGVLAAMLLHRLFLLARQRHSK